MSNPDNNGDAFSIGMIVYHKTCRKRKMVIIEFNEELNEYLCEFEISNNFQSKWFSYHALTKDKLTYKI